MRGRPARRPTATRVTLRGATRHERGGGGQPLPLHPSRGWRAAAAAPRPHPPHPRRASQPQARRACRPRAAILGDVYPQRPRNSMGWLRPPRPTVSPTPAPVRPCPNAHAPSPTPRIRPPLLSLPSPVGGANSCRHQLVAAAAGAGGGRRRPRPVATAAPVGVARRVCPPARPAAGGPPNRWDPPASRRRGRGG